MKARRFPFLAALVLASPFLTAADDDRRTEQIGRAALGYVQGFQALLEANPDEGALIGISASDLADLQVARVIPLYAVDDQFRDRGDRRSLDSATKPTDLWWVLLRNPNGGATVVTIQWAADAAAPEAVGLNWVPAALLAASLTEVGDAAARVIYLPEDAPVIVGKVDGVTVAMPIATETLASRLELAATPQRVGDYTAALRSRLSALEEAAPGGPPVPGLAGSLTGPNPGPTSPTFPLALVAAPVGVVVFFGLLRVTHDIRRRRTR